MWSVRIHGRDISMGNWRRRRRRRKRRRRRRRRRRRKQSKRGHIGTLYAYFTHMKRWTKCAVWMKTKRFMDKFNYLVLVCKYTPGLKPKSP